MKKVTINLYSFDELNENAKQRAINEHKDFLLSLPVELENEAGELEKYYELDYSDSEVVDHIETNEYVFFSNGDLASCTTYTGSHPKAGQTEFKFKGETYTI